MLWGDGFVDDGLVTLARVASWAEITPDEHALLFPALAPRDGRLPPPLVARLASCARVLRMRERRAAGRDTPFEAVAAAEEYDWFAYGADFATSPILIGVVEDALAAVEDGRQPLYSEGSEFALGFLAGFHPGYMWAEAASSPDRGLLACWLGMLWRGRAALVPHAVADALSDSSTSRDPDVLAACGGANGLARLSRAAVSGDGSPKAGPVRMRRPSLVLAVLAWCSKQSSSFQRTRAVGW